MSIIYEKKADRLYTVDRRHGMSLQQLPLRTEEGKRLAASFFPRRPPITVDFSSLELRMWTELSRASAQKGK